MEVQSDSVGEGLEAQVGWSAWSDKARKLLKRSVTGIVTPGTVHLVLRNVTVSFWYGVAVQTNLRRRSRQRPYRRAEEGSVFTARLVESAVRGRIWPHLMQLRPARRHHAECTRVSCPIAWPEQFKLQETAL